MTALYAKRMKHQGISPSGVCICPGDRVPPARPPGIFIPFTSVGESLSVSMSDALECPETSSLSSLFILSRPSEESRKTQQRRPTPPVCWRVRSPPPPHLRVWTSRLRRAALDRRASSPASRPGSSLVGRPVNLRPPPLPRRFPTSAYLCAHKDADAHFLSPGGSRCADELRAAHLIILPLTSISCRRLSSKDSAAAAEAVDTLLSFP